MKVLFIIVFFNLLMINNSQFTPEEPRKIFIDYLTKYKIVYDSKVDFEKHLNTFLQTYKNPDFKIEEFLNIKDKKKRRLTKAEYSVYSTNNDARRNLANDDDETLPDEFEWKGGINRIQDQGKCGACAVFSVMSAFEFYYYNKFRRERKFSEQAVIDCFILNGDICAEGANIYYIYNFIENYWPMLESDYPYISYNETHITQFCKFNISKTVNITNPILYKLIQSEKTGYVTAYSIAYHIYNYGPVVAMVNADCEDFYMNFNNSKYIISSHDPLCDPTELNHAVIITGWGFSTTNKLYWIVRNSWGKEWGDEGYAYILGGENTFGIETDVGFISDKFKEPETDSEILDEENTCVCEGKGNYLRTKILLLGFIIIYLVLFID